MSKRSKGKKSKKKERVSIRDQRRQLGRGGGANDTKTSDPIGCLDSEWFKNAREAEKWKPKWECMQTLMEYCSGDGFGNAELPKQFDDNSKAGDVIAIFAKWMTDGTVHIFTRQHILKLLVPFGNSFGKSHWKKATKLAEGLIIKQWMEKKHGFLPLVTPALISVYIASNAQLKKWKEFLLESMDSTIGQVRMSCWDFLAKICVLSKQSGSKLRTRGPKDVELFINDSKIIEYLKKTILNDKEKEVRESCAKFIYGAKHICNKVSVLESAYTEILDDKRASMALDIAAELFNNDKTMLSGGKVNEDAVAKKVERKQAQQKKKQASSRKNNMRAMIAQAKRDAAKKGGGGKIEVGVSGSGSSSVDKSPSKKESKSIRSKKERVSASTSKSKKKTKSDDGGSESEEDRDSKKEERSKTKTRAGRASSGGGMKALMNKYKKNSKTRSPSPGRKSDGEESDDNKSDATESESDDSEAERERERERKRKERERQRKEREKERDRKRKEKERERARKKKEEEDRKRREREREKERERERERERARSRKKRRYDDSDSDSDEETESSTTSDSEETDRRSRRSGGRRRGQNKTINESRTATVDSNSPTAKTTRGKGGASLAEIQKLTEKVDVISLSVQTLQSGMNGMERRVGDIAKNSETKSGMSTKTEEKIMKILGQLQRDVKIMKNDISYIKACWEDAVESHDCVILVPHCDQSAHVMCTFRNRLLPMRTVIDCAPRTLLLRDSCLQSSHCV